MIRHIAMCNVRGSAPDEKRGNIYLVRRAFHGLRGLIPGLIHLKIGVDASQIDYASDVVLYSEFESHAAQEAYASHPEHLRVRDELVGVRIEWHQVHYAVEELRCQ
jgi:predicted SAM-dependent methyltransferase